MHTLFPPDTLEVITPHGPGIVIYVTIFGSNSNDEWCIANKKDGEMRHYQTIQLKLEANGMMGIEKTPSIGDVVDSCLKERGDLAGLTEAIEYLQSIKYAHESAKQ